LKKNIDVTFAILSIAPISIWLLFSFISPFIGQDDNSKGLFTIMDLYPGLFGKITVFALFVGFFFAIYLAIKVLQNNFVPKEKKYLWVFLLVFGSIVILPFFWSFYIRKSRFAP